MNSILRQAGLRRAEERGGWKRRFLIVIESAGSNYSAYSPDLPGCVATGKSSSEAERNMRRAIDLHLQGLAEDDAAMQAPRSSAGYVTVDL